jgi:malate dehydrogenase (oxaloacetate-decarboxylating)
VAPAVRCTLPTGVTGLEWVYPTFDHHDGACVDVLRAHPEYRRPTMWTCAGDIHGRPLQITYSELTSVASGLAYHEKLFADGTKSAFPGPHGTAIVVTAALTNALRVVEKPLADVRIVVSGAGAAGSAIVSLLLAGGARDVVVCDRDGALCAGDEALSPAMAELAGRTNPRGVRGDLRTALQGADVFIGVSAPKILEPEWIGEMGEKPVVFALANPDPEVDPAEAEKYAAVVASGRSDYPNQINNVLAFPGVFRGLLDARASEITTEMLLRAASAIAHVVKDEELNPNFIIPTVFHPDVPKAVAAAIRGQ